MTETFRPSLEQVRAATDFLAVPSSGPLYEELLAYLAAHARRVVARAPAGHVLVLELDVGRSFGDRSFSYTVANTAEATEPVDEMCSDLFTRYRAAEKACVEARLRFECAFPDDPRDRAAMLLAAALLIDGLTRTETGGDVTMAKVEHRFGLWVTCVDCDGQGVRKVASMSGIVCQRCKGETFVPLIVTPVEMAALLAGGSVESDPEGKYKVLTKDGGVP